MGDRFGAEAVIRIATADDIAEMHRIRLAVRENRLANPDTVRHGDYEARLAAAGRGWIATADGAAVGFAVADLARGNVWALFVDPAHEGRGIGRRLHDVMIEWLFASGVNPIWLSTEPNTRAERFYRRAGWVQVGIQPSGELRLELAYGRRHGISL
jgi:GNAT superfamily N-acetyltransferase